jgi:transcriptional regulator with GAF, ATPase, and Fis domain
MAVLMFDRSQPIIKSDGRPDPDHRARGLRLVHRGSERGTMKQDTQIDISSAEDHSVFRDGMCMLRPADCGRTHEMRGSTLSIELLAQSSSRWYMEPSQEPQPSGRYDLSPNEFEGIIGSCQSLRRVLDQVRIVAPTGATVLIEGETGTGKELVARAIHMQSERRNCPFVKLNCAAIPRDLLESELFGHEKGAFTGAVMQRIGRFEAANRGTLFLDEIGDMPKELQSKLLRVLQEQEFERLGSAYTHRVDVRVVAATNQDLEGLVAEKQFRMDLYYRLNVFPLAIPPLRQRLDDIPMLVAHFVQKFGQRMSKQISKISRDGMDALMRYPWPGNIRELQNFIERAVVLSTGDMLQVPPLPRHLPAKAEPMTLKETELDHIQRVLEESNWIVGGKFGAAARLGIARTTLLSRMRKLGISRETAVSSKHSTIPAGNSGTNTPSLLAATGAEQ